MIDFDTKFFYELRDTASKDLSQAHLIQHFTAAKHYLTVADQHRPSQGTWGAQKSFDTVSYSNGLLNGKKHWISGISLCEWAIITVKYDQGSAVVLVDVKDLDIQPVPTLGMEDTLTSHVNFVNTPATFLYDKQNPKCLPVDSHTHLSFLTIQLGLMQALINDIDAYTGPKFDYEKKKFIVDVDIMSVLWESEVASVNQSYHDQKKQWNKRSLIYAFGKKTLVNIANFVTEVTGSGLYETCMPGHQRYKDALIYVTHMQNVSAAVDFYTQRKNDQ